MNQEAIVDQIVQNLAFDVEAVPKKISNRTTNISESTPLNVKIKVRKKDEIHMQPDLLPNGDNTSQVTIKKIRLVNSDQTIMTFDVFMEAEIEKKPQIKRHKHNIINKLKPGICLGTEDDNEYPYVPSSSYSANITEPSTVTRSNGTLKQTFTLSKNYPVSTQPREQKWLFGKCKPGGCLDPPFSEDRYSYKPSTISGPGREQVEIDEDVGSEVHNNSSPIKLHDEEVQSNERHSSILASGFFKPKRKSSDKLSKTKLPDKTDSIVNLYTVGSVTNSTSTHSNSIITYPPRKTSAPRISDNKTVKTQESNESRRRKAFNDHSEPLFARRKGINHISEKDTFNPSYYNPKHRSSDATDLENSCEESIKEPLPIPIPIPVPIPIISNVQRSEKTFTNNNVLKTQGDNAKLDSVPIVELKKEINLKDSDIQAHYQRSKTPTGSTDGKPMESLNKTTSFPSKVEESIIPNEIDDQGLVTTILQPVYEVDSKNNTKDTPQPHTNSKTGSLKIPLPIPTSFSESSLPAAVDSKTLNDLQVTDRQSAQSKQSFETKATPTITDKNNYEDSKKLSPVLNRVEDNEATANTTLKTQYSDMEISDTENPVTKVPIITENIPQGFNEDIEKSATLDDVKDSDKTAPKHTEYLRRDSSPDQVNDIENPITEIPKITGNITHGSNEDIKKSATLDDVKDTDTTAPKYTEYLRRDSSPAQISDIENPITEVPIITGNITHGSNEDIEKSAILDVVKDTDTTAPNQSGNLHKGSSSDQTSDIEIPVTEVPIKTENITQDSNKNIEKSIKLDDVKDRDTTAPKYTEYLRRDSLPDEASDIENPVTEIPTITGNITQGSNEDIKNSATLGDVKESDATVPKYTENLHRGSLPDQTSYIKNPVTEVPIIAENITLNSDEIEILDKIEKYATQNNVKDKDFTATNHIEESSDVYVAPNADIHQTKESPNRDELKDSKTISISKLPIIKKNIEVKNKGIQEINAEVGSKIGHKDTDLIDHEDEKYTSLSNGPEYETNSVDHKKGVDETTEANNDHKIDSDSQTRFIDEKSMNFLEVPVIDNSEQIPNLRSQVKKVNSDTIRSSINHDLIGVTSVIKEKPIPSTFPEKNAEILSSDNLIAQSQSTSTIKSAMKKDTISVELGFHSYLNDNNERMLRTFDAAHAPKRSPSSSVTVLKSIIRISSNEIRIPVDSGHDMSIQIKKTKPNQCVSISESGFENVVDDGVLKKQKPPIQSSDAKLRRPETNANAYIPEKSAFENATNKNIIDYYEQELIPLQSIIRDLRKEVDVLAAQQLMIKEKICNSNKSKLPRLVHSNKRCIGCLRK